MPTSIHKSYISTVLLLVIVGVSFYILWPFAKIILLAGVCAVLTGPLYRVILAKVRAPWVAALFTVILFIMIICVPLFAVGTIIATQGQHLYQWIQDAGGVGVLMQSVHGAIVHLVPGFASFDIAQSASRITGTMTDLVAKTFSATFTTIGSFLLMIVTCFYFLKDGTVWKSMFVSHGPFTESYAHTILERFRTVVRTIFRGYLLVGCVQGIVLGVGLYLFGVPYAALWGGVLR